MVIDHVKAYNVDGDYDDVVVNDDEHSDYGKIVMMEISDLGFLRCIFDSPAQSKSFLWIGRSESPETFWINLLHAFVSSMDWLKLVVIV